MELQSPSLAYVQDYRKTVEEFAAVNVRGFWTLFNHAADDVSLLRQMSDHALEREGAIFVPASIYWLIDRNAITGFVSIRHRLNDRLRQIGGHIGIYVRPSLQRQGYGTKMLALALEKAKAIGLSEVLITCDEDNAGSRKVIERNGGHLQKKVDVDGGTLLHFLIKL